MGEHWTDVLEPLAQWDDARAWALLQPDLGSAWPLFTRGDWMLRFAARSCRGRFSRSRRRVAAAALACVCESIRYAPASRRAALEQWQAYLSDWSMRRHTTGGFIALIDLVAHGLYDVDECGEYDGRFLARCADVVREHIPKPPPLTREAES